MLRDVLEGRVFTIEFAYLIFRDSNKVQFKLDWTYDVFDTMCSKDLREYCATCKRRTAGSER